MKSGNYRDFPPCVRELSQSFLVSGRGSFDKIVNPNIHLEAPRMDKRITLENSEEV